MISQSETFLEHKKISYPTRTRSSNLIKRLPSVPPFQPSGLRCSSHLLSIGCPNSSDVSLAGLHIIWGTLLLSSCRNWTVLLETAFGKSHSGGLRNLAPHHHVSIYVDVCTCASHIQILVLWIQTRIILCRQAKGCQRVITLGRMRSWWWSNEGMLRRRLVPVIIKMRRN